MSDLRALRPVGSKMLTDGIQVVPNAATDLSTVDSWIFQLHVSNISGGAVTLLIKDKAGTPLTLVPTVSIAANAAYILVWPLGVKMTGGINWVASAATSLYAEVLAFTHT